MLYKHLENWHKFSGSKFELQLNWMRRPISANGEEAVTLGNIAYCYNEAIEKLFDAVDMQGNMDAIGLPLLLLVKHAVEIGMKNIIYEVHLRELVYGDSLWKRYDEIEDGMNRKREKISGKKHDLVKLYSALLNQLEVVREKTGVDLRTVMNESSYAIIQASRDESCNCAKVCGNGLKEKLGKQLPFFEILAELCHLFSADLDPEDCAFKYDVTLKNSPSLKIQGDGCIDVAMVVCHYLQISIYLYDIQELLMEVFEGHEEEFREFEDET
ncbi:MAG: hypothetical protein HQK87_09625 [Nitrospinae bacterium]|nr:hypothetical protein [Nitrospinota bacterium]